MEMLLDPNFILSTDGDALRSKFLCGCERSKRKERVCVWGAHLSCYRPHDPRIVMAEVLYLAQSCDVLASQVAQMEYSDRPLV
jgi:hypothetical protein